MKMKSVFKSILTMGALTSIFSVCSLAQGAKLNGKVLIDGSSTVFPISEAIAEEYRTQQPRVKVNIGVSGTGGGFKKFTKGETDINNASRPIKNKEAKIADTNKIKYVELPVAYDGLTVVVNPKNTWATDMTPAELKMIWDRGSKIKTWSAVRKGWPNQPIKLFGPGTDSGTFDYFTEAINGKSGRSRADYTKSEDDNVLVTGVTGNLYSMGYFGYAYYKSNTKRLKAVKISGVSPSEKTINDGSYKPLSRPIFIYVSNTAYKKPAVADFVQFYLKEAANLVREVGYVPLPNKKYTDSLKLLSTLK